MPMNAEQLASFIWLIDEDIIRPHELPTGKRFNTDAEYPSAINGEGIWILDFKGSDAGASSIETFFVAC